MSHRCQNIGPQPRGAQLAHSHGKRSLIHGSEYSGWTALRARQPKSAGIDRRWLLCHGHRSEKQFYYLLLKDACCRAASNLDAHRAGARQFFLKTFAYLGGGDEHPVRQERHSPFRW